MALDAKSPSVNPGLRRQRIVLEANRTFDNLLIGLSPFHNLHRLSASERDGLNSGCDLIISRYSQESNAISLIKKNKPSRTTTDLV